jgi:hypothetical protein
MEILLKVVTRWGPQCTLVGVGRRGRWKRKKGEGGEADEVEYEGEECEGK